MLTGCIREEYSEMKEYTGTQSEINSILNGDKYHASIKYTVVNYDDHVYYLDHKERIYTKQVEDYPHPALVVFITVIIMIVVIAMISQG